MRTEYYLTMFAAVCCLFMAGCPAGEDGNDSGDQPADVLVAEDTNESTDTAVAEDTTVAEDTAIPEDTTVGEDAVMETPSIVGNWDIESIFRLYDAVPPPADIALDVLASTLTNPVVNVLTLMCDPAMLGLQVPTDFCNLLFTDPTTPSIVTLNDFGTFVAEMLDANVMQMLGATCPYEDPAQCEDIYFTNFDLVTLLNPVLFLSSMRCTADPDAGTDTLPADACSELWHTVKYRWAVGVDCESPQDPECGIVMISMSAIPGIEMPLEAEISGSVTSAGELGIDRHLVGLKVGKLVDFGLQKIAIPRLYGDGSDALPVVDSYQKLVGAVLAGRQCLATDSCCADFETAVLAQYPETPTGIASAACEFVTATAMTSLLDKIDAIDVSGGVRIGTPAETPALMADTDDDGVFDTIGSVLEPSVWDGILYFGGFDNEFDGTFTGVRD